MTIAWALYPAAQLSQLSAKWNTLNAESGNLPFLDTAFLLPLLECFGSGRERIAIALRGEDAVAATILQPLGRGRWHTFQPSQLPLGPWLARSGEAPADLLPTLIRVLPGITLSVGLTQLDSRFVTPPENSPLINYLDYIETAWVDIDSDFEAYWNGRWKNLRTNTRKQRSKLENEGIQPALDVLTRPEDIAEALAEYGRLEASGWKVEMGTAVALDNAQGRFYREMMKAFCGQGRGEVWRYRFGDTTVAMDLCVAAGRTLVVLKTAFDSSHKTTSPATLLHQDAFRRVFESGQYDRIEFYGRIMEWHTRWTDRARKLFHITAYRWAAIGQVHALVRRFHSHQEQ